MFTYEIIYNIINYLTYLEILKFQQINKYIFNLCEDNILLNDIIQIKKKAYIDYKLELEFNEYVKHMERYDYADFKDTLGNILVVTSRDGNERIFNYILSKHNGNHILSIFCSRENWIWFGGNVIYDFLCLTDAIYAYNLNIIYRIINNPKFFINDKIIPLLYVLKGNRIISLSDQARKIIFKLIFENEKINSYILNNDINIYNEFKCANDKIDKLLPYF